MFDAAPFSRFQRRPMAEFTFRVSNCVEDDGGAAETSNGSWTVVYDGPVATRKEAIDLADMLSVWWRRVQVFKRKAPGKVWLERHAALLTA